MNSGMNQAEVIRFEIAVNCAAYRSLVEGLREPSVQTYSAPSLKHPIKAEVHLDLSSQRYSVQKLGRHRLPSSVDIRPGSQTHRNISGILAHSLRSQESHDLHLALRDIIAAAPTLGGDLLRIFKKDLEFQPKNSRPLIARPVSDLGLIATISPTLTLDLDETPTLIIPERPEDLLERAVSLLREHASLSGPVSAQVTDNTATIFAKISLPRIEGFEIDTFLHWGSYDELSPAWQDEPVTTQHCSATKVDTINHQIHIPSHGWYGATVFVQIRGSSEPIWLGKHGRDDASMYVACDDSRITSERDQMLGEMRELSREILSLSIENPHTLDAQVENISTLAPHVGLGALLAEVSPEPSENLCKILEVLHRTPSSSPTESMFLNYGIGEVVFTTPEGPHAAAGGLAQVISGLPIELCRAGVPVSVITPIYSYENGNKHSSAQKTLSQGIMVDGERVKPIYVGAVTVNVGPTYYSGTTWTCRQPTALPIKVYLAQKGSLRIFLLSNSSVFDRLYQPVYADEQLRRAIVLSRATLETIATSHFGIRPSALISNDWTTACVPAFAALDSRYQSIQWLRDCKTIHMIHNGGGDYHGRLPVNLSNEDLWPMLGLGSDHFFGFRDPHSWNLINFTMAAAQHVSGALLTVSQPYAQQIVSPGGGDGVDYVLQHRKGAVFGISNGINKIEIDRYLSTLTGLETHTLDSIDSLLAAKASTKRTIQARYGLALKDNARIMSFVGRLAEQKGLSLLSGFVDHGNHSMLEDILIRHEDVQILIAGPMTDGDKTAVDLRQSVEYLQSKYPGRIRSHFDYVPHAKALEIIFGSSFFLMPSRFEPGGITQLESMAAGTLVIGRNVGGISATIENYSAESTSGNGFLCNDYSATALANTTHWALESTKSQSVYRSLVINARRAKHTWADRVPAYQAMLQRVILGEERFSALPWNDAHKDQLSTLTVS
jgi:starch synthase